MSIKYSIRRGTRAERMDNPVPERAKQIRSSIVREIATGNELQDRRSFIGEQQAVLVEKVNKNGHAKGYGQHYVRWNSSLFNPDTNYFKIIP